MKRGLLFISGIAACITANAQSFIQPNYGLKSHETLEINKIEISAKGTLFYMSIENRIQGGTFCADRDIYMIYPDGSKSRLTTASGIPVCPDVYKFKAPGERIEFTLLFPQLKEGTSWIDLTEECDENCFSFYGITLDNELNRRINESFALAESEEASKAIISLIDLVREIDSRNPGIEGLLYSTLVKLADASGTKVVAGEWYKKMKSSGAPRLHLYLKNLESQGIRY